MFHHTLAWLSFVQILHLLFIAQWLPFFCIPRVQKFYDLVISFYNLVLPHFLSQWLTHTSSLHLLIRYADFCSCTQLTSIFLRHIISNSVLSYIPFRREIHPSLIPYPLPISSEADWTMQPPVLYHVHLLAVCEACAQQPGCALRC